MMECPYCKEISLPEFRGGECTNCHMESLFPMSTKIDTLETIIGRITEIPETEMPGTLVYQQWLAANVDQLVANSIGWGLSEQQGCLARLISELVAAKKQAAEADELARKLKGKELECGRLRKQLQGKEDSQ